MTAMSTRPRQRSGINSSIAELMVAGASAQPGPVRRLHPAPREAERRCCRSIRYAPRGEGVAATMTWQVQAIRPPIGHGGRGRTTASIGGSRTESSRVPGTVRGRSGGRALTRSRTKESVYSVRIFYRDDGCRPPRAKLRPGGRGSSVSRPGGAPCRAGMDMGRAVIDAGNAEIPGRERE